MDWWAIVSLVATSVLAIYLYLRQRRPKHLDYAVHINSSLLITGYHKPPQIVVLCNNIEVQHPRLVVLRLQNTGREPIHPADYDKPVTISLPSTAVRMDYGATTSNPGSYSVALHEVDDHFTISAEAVLMNPGDYYDVEMIVDGLLSAKDLTVTARIAGVQQVRDMTGREDRAVLRFRLFMATITGVLGVITGILAGQFLGSLPSPTLDLVFLLLFLMSVTAMWIRYLRRRK